MKSVAERAKALFTDHDVRQNAFAAKYGISKYSLNGYLNGTRTIPYDVLVLLAEHFGVTCDYLLGVTSLSQRPFPLSSGERELVAVFRGLTPAQQELIAGNLRIMQSQNEQRYGQVSGSPT